MKVRTKETYMRKPKKESSVDLLKKVVDLLTKSKTNGKNSKK